MVIYLFLNPFILPIAKMFLQDILGINNPFMPIILTAITIPICILAYRATKLVRLNKMLE
jgi:hypothetical protein